MINRHTINSNRATEKSETLRHLRNLLHKRDFVEIHSPCLVRATPPLASIKLGNCMFALRGSMELLLRSALVSGLQKVYEIGPAFRMMESDELRHPEFYMLELFQAFLDYSGLVELTKEILRDSIGIAPSKLSRISVAQWLSHEMGLDCECTNIQLKAQLIERFHELKPIAEEPTFVLLNRLIEKHLEPPLKGWSILEDFPTCSICLAARQAANPFLIQRCEIFCDSVEIAHGFVDATDPNDVRSRMRENGPMFADYEFANLLEERCLPPSAGVGFGIERLLLATHPGVSIRDFVHLSQFITS
jgi:lysyl-tRNA synthetase class 2